MNIDDYKAATRSDGNSVSWEYLAGQETTGTVS